MDANYESGLPGALLIRRTSTGYTCITCLQDLNGRCTVQVKGIVVCHYFFGHKIKILNHINFLFNSIHISVWICKHMLEEIQVHTFYAIQRICNFFLKLGNLYILATL